MEDVLDKVNIDSIISTINHTLDDDYVADYHPSNNTLYAIEHELEAQGVYIVW